MIDFESILSRKSEMYAMVISIEDDFISNFKKYLDIEDIPENVIKKSNPVFEEQDALLQILRGIDIQSFIEICNSNIIKLNINMQQKKFVNSELSKIIQIRNNVMHPRPLGYFDYSILKTVFENIATELQCFSWEHVKKTMVQILNNPETLVPPPDSLKKNERIIENLPSLLDYEETSFIGRKNEIGEIRAQLNRRNVHVLSIIGDGGVGKTATTLKLLYDMLDDPKCPYELILWTSLKTNELSENDFKEIANSVKTTSQMYEKLAPFVGSESINEAKEFIIELAQSFNTLFVLDNLETINTADINDFIDEFSEYGKVLITSRIGLGEMEHRYKLNGFNDADVLEYTNILLTLYGFECFYTDEAKKNLFIGKLHSNPLAIKWFIRCLYNGQSEEEILNHKEDVINFCMANVYEKLSTDAHEVLDILNVIGVQLSFPELMYYLENNLSDCTRIKYAINELGKCNFIDELKFKQDKNIAVTEFASEFLSLHRSDVKHLFVRVREAQQRLSSFGQQLLIKKAEDNLDIKSIHYRNNAELVAAIYLYKAINAQQKAIDAQQNAIDAQKNAIDAQQDAAFDFVKFAQELVPLYYENNLILAQIYGVRSQLKAVSEYEKAVKHCRNEEEKVRTYLLYVDFLVKINDYRKALDILNEAEKLNVNVIETKIQKAKAQSYIGEYEAAEQTLNELDDVPLSNNDINKIQTRRADIHRRRSELIDIRETQKRLVALKLAYQCLEICPDPDSKVFEYMAKILEQLSYMYMDNDVLEFILDIVKKHYRDIKRTAHYSKFRNQITQRLPQIQNDFFQKEIPRYIIDYNAHFNLLKSNEAVVYNLKQGFGFCKNQLYPGGLYFSMKGLPQDIDYGDILSYSSVLDSKGKLSIVFPKRIGTISERIEMSRGEVFA